MSTRPAAAASALAIGVLLGANGCVDNRASVQIQMICAPNETCTFSGECDAQFIGFVTLDHATSARDALWLVLQVENQLPNNADAATGRANTNDAHVDETVIEYVGVALPRAVVGSNFDVPAGGTAVISAEVIPDAIQAGPALQALAPSAEPREIVAKMRMRGYYDDATRFETGEFPVTIRICSGCAPVLCGGAGTCPPLSEGQLPLDCVE
jgi:hypothetical protein